MSADNPVTQRIRRQMTADLHERQAALGALQVEIEHLNATLKLLGGPLADDHEAASVERRAERALMPPNGAATSPEPVTIPEFILGILDRRPNGAGAPFIIGEINKTRRTKGTSVYPSLHKMSANGSIRREGSGRAAIYFAQKKDK